MSLEQGEIPIDHRSPRPLFLQVKEGLKSWIQNGLYDGTLTVGDRIPSQNELSKMLRVSGITIKQALSELQREGYINRIQGRGSFVAKKEKLVLELEKLYSLTTVAEKYGMTPARRVLDLREVPASRRVAGHLEIGEGDRVVKLVRLRLVDDTPLAVDTSYIPLALFPGLLMDNHDEGSLYGLMTHKYGMEPVRAREFFEPVLINAFESDVLRVPIGSPAMLAERIAYNSHDTPIELNRSILRGDWCRFSIDVHKGDFDE